MSIATLKADKLDFKEKLIRRDKNGQSILIKRTVNQEDITILNTCALNFRVPNFIKIYYFDLKKLINPITVGNFRSTFSNTQVI